MSFIDFVNAIDNKVQFVYYANVKYIDNKNCYMFGKTPKFASEETLNLYIEEIKENYNVVEINVVKEKC